VLIRRQPTNAYFGQKDIQQALLMRRLVSDLHFTHPTASRLRIIPTGRDPKDGLAHSSRNAYLNAAERQQAPVFYAALQEAARVWATGASKREVVKRTIEQLEVARDEGKKHGVEIRVVYIKMNDSVTFEEIGDEQVQRPDCAPVLLTGAVWFGRTRLIDNIVLGNTDGIIAKPM
jgi:pantoate--beta-alanine ligase